MSEKCKVQESLCRCVDWHEGETADWVDHLLRNYEFDRLMLDYSTLEKGTEIRLCQIGQCSKCGGQICIGTVIHPCELLDDTLARVYAEGGAGTTRMRILTRCLSSYSEAVISR